MSNIVMGVNQRFTNGSDFNFSQIESISFILIRVFPSARNDWQTSDDWQ
jgi:hypothetical protein